MTQDLMTLDKDAMRELKERDPIAYQKAMITRLEWLARQRKQDKKEQKNVDQRKFRQQCKKDGICYTCCKRKVRKGCVRCSLCQTKQNLLTAKNSGKPFSVKVGKTYRHFHTQAEANEFAQKLLNSK